MFKSVQQGVLLLALLGGTLPLFQNCGVGGFMVSAEFASTDMEEYDSLHEDYDFPDLRATEETTYEGILADRYLLRSIFEDVFGPTATSVDTTRASFNVQGNGAPCSVYEDYRGLAADGKTLVRADNMQVCSAASADMTTVQTLPKVAVTRQALLAQACSDLTTNATTIGFALKKIVASGVPPATDENVTKAIQLFYRDVEPTRGQIDALSLMLTPNGVTIDEWRSVVYTVCVSPQWQIL